MKTGLCKVRFSSKLILDLPFRHFCGGTSIKLPREMADFRKQWVFFTPDTIGGEPKVGRYSVASVVFPE
jgi:hypothetical protein